MKQKNKIIIEEKHNSKDIDTNIFNLLDSSFKLNFIMNKKCKKHILKTYDLIKISECAKITNYNSIDYNSIIIPVKKYNNLDLYYYTDFIRLVFNKVDSNAYLFFRNKGLNGNFITISKLNEDFKIKYKFLISDNNTILYKHEFDYKNKVKITYSSNNKIYLDTLKSIFSIEKLFNNKNEFQKIISKEKIVSDSIIPWLDNVP